MLRQATCNQLTMKQLVFEKFKWWQGRHHVFRTVAEGKPEIERSEKEWNYGFDFIEEHGPRDDVRNRGLRRATIQIASKDSPIHKWPTTLVEKNLRNLGQESVIARVHEVWPLPVYDLDPRVLTGLGPLLSTLSEKALGVHGLPGAGKTPVARSIAMALSRYWVDKLGKRGR